MHRLHNDHTQLCSTSNLNSSHLGGRSSLLSSLVHAPAVCSSNDLWNKSNHILQKRVGLKFYDLQASTHFYAGTKQSKYTILSLHTKGEGSFSPHAQVLFNLERWSQAQLHKEWSLLSNLRSQFFYLVSAALKYKLQPIQYWIESPPIC